MRLTSIRSGRFVVALAPMLAALACAQGASERATSATPGTGGATPPIPGTGGADLLPGSGGAADVAETGVEAGQEAGPGAETNPTRCPEPLAGEAPFARALSGEGQLTSLNPTDPRPARPARIEVHAYFPGGRRLGAPVILAMPGRYPHRALFFPAAVTLDASAGVAGKGLHVRNDLGFGFSGALIGPDQGLVGEGHANFAFGTDVADEARGPITLCPSGSVPAPELITDHETFSPTQHLQFAPTAPFDPTRPPDIQVTAAGKPVAAGLQQGHIYFGTGGVSWWVVATSAFPPNQPVTIDFGGAHDVLGRPFTVRRLPAPLVTTAVVADRSFATLPPAGALAVGGGTDRTTVVLNDGALVIGTGPSDSEGQALLALGDPGSAASVRILAGLDCKIPNVGSVGVDLVSEAGETARIRVECGAPQAVTVQRPGTGPLWLSVIVGGGWRHPQVLPRPPADRLRLDDITFE